MSERCHVCRAPITWNQYQRIQEGYELPMGEIVNGRSVVTMTISHCSKNPEHNIDPDYFKKLILTPLPTPAREVSK